jgi:hypothetical protein
MQNRLGMILTCPFCKSQDVVDRRPNFVSRGGKTVAARFHKPFLCLSCLRSLRQVYAKKPGDAAPPEATP